MYKRLDDRTRLGNQHNDYIYESYFEGKSSLFIDLLRKMLRFDPRERITIDGILQHDWVVQRVSMRLEEASAVGVPFDKTYRHNIRRWKYRKQLKQALKHQLDSSRFRKSALIALMGTNLAISDELFRSLQVLLTHSLTHSLTH
jgi:serine/threonine protein kinase